MTTTSRWPNCGDSCGASSFGWPPGTYWGWPPIIEIPEELTIIADAAVAAAVDGLAPEVPFAVIGLGRYGGLDLSYASDLDVIFVYEGATSDEARAANRTARGLLREIGAQTAEGRAWEIDARLRPEGENGQLCAFA